MIFLTGSLWADFSPEKGMQSFTIQTPTCSIELKNAQFDLHTERFFTRLRVNDGTAVVTRLLDQSRSEVRSGEQIECNIDDAAVFDHYTICGAQLCGPLRVPRVEGVDELVPRPHFHRPALVEAEDDMHAAWAHGQRARRRPPGRPNVWGFVWLPGELTPVRAQ